MCAGDAVTLATVRERLTPNDGWLVLAAIGLGVWGFRNTAVGLALLVGGVVGWLLFRLLLPHLPWEIVRKKQPPPPRPSLPMPNLPLWLDPRTTRKAAANVLLEEGYNLLAIIPNKAASPVAAALAGIYPDSEKKLLAQWEGRVVMFLHARAPENTALFHPARGIPVTGAPMHSYLTDRLDELKAIHAQL
jgi:hypothetical protein